MSQMYFVIVWKERSEGKWRNSHEGVTILVKYPTEHFTISGPRNPFISTFRLWIKPVGAIKLLNVRSGRMLAVLSNAMLARKRGKNNGNRIVVCLLSKEAMGLNFSSFFPFDGSEVFETKYETQAPIVPHGQPTCMLGQLSYKKSTLKHCTSTSWACCYGYLENDGKKPGIVALKKHSIGNTVPMATIPR